MELPVQDVVDEALSLMASAESKARCSRAPGVTSADALAERMSSVRRAMVPTTSSGIGAQINARTGNEVAVTTRMSFARGIAPISAALLPRSSAAGTPASPGLNGSVSPIQRRPLVKRPGGVPTLNGVAPLPSPLGAPDKRPRLDSSCSPAVMRTPRPGVGSGLSHVPSGSSPRLSVGTTTPQ